ncbi:MAG: hypothetical protein V4560_14790 [Bacteroidota bacterium]
MPIQRIDSIYDLAALTAEQEKYLALLEQSKAAIIDLNSQRVTAKSADLSNFTKAAAELDKAIDKTNKTTDVAVKENAELIKSIKDLTTVMTESAKSNQKKSGQQAESTKKTLEETIANQKNTKELKAQAQAELSAIGSREKALAQIKVLTIAKDKLNLESEEEKKEYDQIVIKLQKYEQFLKKTGSEAEKQRLNIGNYSGAVSILKTSFDQVADKMAEMTKAGKTNTDVFAQMEKEYALLNKLVNSQEAGFANATMEIRANQKALLDLENAGLAGTESFKKLEQATGELQDQLGDLKARTKTLGSDTFVFDGLIDAAQGLAGAYGAAQGVAALFGEENEDLQKTMVKLQAVMAVVQGLQAVQNALQAESAGMMLLQDIRTKALAVSQGIYAVAVGTSTGAMKLFRIALLATGIGAIIGLLYLAADAMGVFGSSAEDTTKSLEEQAEQMKKNKDSLDEIGQAAEKERNRAKGGLNDLRRALELAEARGASEKELQKLKDDIYAKERLNMLVSFNTFAGYADKQNDINDAGLDLKNKYEASKLASEKKALDEAEKARKEKADKQAKENERAIAKAKKFAEDEAEAMFNIFRDNAEERARLAMLGADDEKAPLEARLAALQDYYSERQSVIIAQKDFDLKSEVKGSQQAKEIMNKAEIERNKLYEELLNKRLEITKNNSDNIIAANKAKNEKLVKGEEDAAEAIRAVKERQYVDDIIALNASFEAGTISLAQYNKARVKLDTEYQITSLKTEIDHQKKLIEISTLSTDQKKQALRELAKLEKELSDASVQKKEGEEAAKKEAATSTFSEISRISGETFSVIGGLFNAQATREKNRLKEQQDEAEKKAAREIELVNASTLTEEEKAARIINIQARLAAQKDLIAQKERAAEIKRAQFEKAVSIFNIILNTASAVVKALPNVPLAVLAGVMGAAQLAVAVATPIPKYRVGRGEGKSELAYVHEGEFIHREDGSIQATPTVETLTHLMPKDKVYKNKATMMKELAMSAMPNISLSARADGDVTQAINKMSARIEGAVSAIQISTTNITKEGWRKHNTRLADYDSWVKKYIRG